VLPHVRSGKLRALAVTSGSRAPALPDVPTVQESGVKNFEVTLWLAVFLPARTPTPIVERLNREFAAAIAVPQVREALLLQGLQPETTSPAAFSRYLTAEIAKWTAVVRKANLKPE
jgi:tripartite-type tricarboxylate transporter receptor subunit TctC